MGEIRYTSEIEQESSLDGRVRRGERSRRQIIDAILELIAEGNTDPTADEIARRAKVGVRSVFRHFEDMDSLFAAVQDRVAQEVLPMLEGPPIAGDLDERLAELVGRRARVFERIAPMRRRHGRREARSTVIQEGIALLNERLRDQLVEVLGADLPGSDPDRLELLDALLSFESWERLRGVQRLGRERVTRLLADATLALLAARRA